METPTTIKKPEYTKDWKDLSPGEIQSCLAAHCVVAGLSWKNSKHMATMKRIFDLGNPKITFAKDGSYCRIEEDVNVMAVLFRQYL